MSTQMKLVIPLLDENLVKEDVDEKNGFCGAYIYDKNRPYLDNHIFLMYDITNPTKEDYKRECRFRKHTNIYNIKVAYIKGRVYKIYAYPIINDDIKRIIDMRIKPKYMKNAVRIMYFWKLADDNLNKFLLNMSPMRIKPDWHSIPEYDYQPELYEEMML